MLPFSDPAFTVDDVALGALHSASALLIGHLAGTLVKAGPGHQSSIPMFVSAAISWALYCYIAAVMHGLQSICTTK